MNAEKPAFAEDAATENSAYPGIFATHIPLTIFDGPVGTLIAVDVSRNVFGLPSDEAVRIANARAKTSFEKRKFGWPDAYRDVR